MTFFPFFFEKMNYATPHLIFGFHGCQYFFISPHIVFRCIFASLYYSFYTPRDQKHTHTKTKTLSLTANIGPHHFLSLSCSVVFILGSIRHEWGKKSHQTQLSIYKTRTLHISFWKSTVFSFALFCCFFPGKKHVPEKIIRKRCPK